MNRPDVIRIQDLAVGYGGDALLTDLDFTISRGEVFGILGGSGSGKSTVMKTMIGLLPPITGRVLLNGQDMHPRRREDRDDVLRRVGVLYQGDALFGAMSLCENVALPLEQHTTLSRRARLRLARLKLQLVELQGFEDRRPAEISGGMRRRAAIARAMALDPEVVFMDEPTSGLDPALAADMDAMIERFSKTLRTTFVLVTHDLETIFSIVDRALVLDEKRRVMAALGKPEQLRRETDDPALRRFFGRVSRREEAA